jgi:alpha-tubulin suppressor-like RCC1 family protein
MCLDSNGIVFSFGEGEFGKLGHSGTADVLTPRGMKKDFFGGEKVAIIQAGPFHSAAVTVSGRLYLWGLGDHGQLGFPLPFSFLPSSNRFFLFFLLIPRRSWLAQCAHARYSFVFMVESFC